MNFKKIFRYILCLVPWFLSSCLVKVDTTYYKSLNLPIFAPMPIIFGIVWPILYILVAYSIYHIYKNSTSYYKIYLVINYLANQLYTFCFFTLKSPFLGFVDTLIVLISSMYLYVETKDKSFKYSKYLIPYIGWNIFATVLSFSIYVMN